ncbi:MAG: site-specific DNA-methyltransferase [Cohaesibacter sp.]|nr:site-specific DNA-methyltransferase [Cohaesibacter sp.]
MTELNFKGKEFVYNHHLSVPIRPLEMHGDKGIGDPSLDSNLIIQGDNLHALKALLPMYAGKVDCIFIDPPYNTGNEGWAYNDNVNAPMIKEWLAANPIGIDDGLRHDKWCAMMWPRLKLLHELLAEDGMLCVSIDDNETHRLRHLLEDIFGVDGFLAEVVWRSADSSNNDAKRFSVDHNTLYFFSKDADWISAKLDRREENNAHYTNPDDDPKGPWFPGNLSSPNPRDNLRYTIQHPDGRTLEPPSNGWRWSEALMDEKLESGEVTFSESERGILRKTYLADQDGLSPSTLWIDLDETGHNRNAKYELKRLFPELQTSELFPTPKPSKLISKILRVQGKQDAVVLDSFAGSATTAHAVLQENAIDGGNRRFILVEMEDYAPSVTSERVRRVINGYDFQGTQKTELLREKLSWSKIDKADKLRDQVTAIENLHGHEFDRIAKAVKDDHLVVTGEKKVANRAEGLGGSFTYCTLGDPIELDAILTGESLPDWKALGRILFHMATSQPLDAGTMEEGRFYLGTHAGTHVWLIYKPDLDWLKSPEAALNLSFARAVAKGAPDDRHIVFAPARHVSQKMLADQGLPVEFAPLPFALYRLERD